jgi:hypothetical protein
VPDGATAVDLVKAQIQRILARGDVRDRAAAHRDVAADQQLPEEQARTAWLDRECAAEDRDEAAADRSDLTDLLRGRVRPEGTES